MRILIEGAQGTGKTTIVNEIKKQLSDSVVMEALRPNKELKGDALQYDLIDRFLKQIQDNPNGIWDRGILSGLAMTHFLCEKGELSTNVFEYYRNLIDTNLKNVFDKVFILVPLSDTEVPDDNRRDTNVANRDFIQKDILKYADQFGLDYTLLGRVPVEERVKPIIKAWSN